MSKSDKVTNTNNHKNNKFWLDPPSFFAKLTKADDQEIDLCDVAIMIAAEQHQGIVLERYFNHIIKLENRVAELFQTFLEEDANDDVDTQMACLKQVIFEEYEYKGNDLDYDHLDNADLIRVIDERKGLPVALGIIWITLARRQGWVAEGINFPGHFYCRLSKDGEHRLVDPFDEGRPVEASDMRQKLKMIRGESAELSADFYQPVRHRDVLIRLQNNIKMRQISMEDYEAALKTVSRMQLIDPKEPRLYYDSGILHAKLEQPQAAISALETYLSYDNLSPLDREEAQTIITQIKTLLQ